MHSKHTLGNVKEKRSLILSDFDCSCSMPRREYGALSPPRLALCARSGCQLSMIARSLLFVFTLVHGQDVNYILSEDACSGTSTQEIITTRGDCLDAAIWFNSRFGVAPSTTLTTIHDGEQLPHEQALAATGGQYNPGCYTKGSHTGVALYFQDRIQGRPLPTHGIPEISNICRLRPIPR